MAKATTWPDTDAKVRKRGEQTGLYPGSPRRKRCQLGVGEVNLLIAAANALS